MGDSPSPFILKAEGFDEALPGLVAYLRRAVYLSVLDYNDVGLVVVR